MIAIAEPLEAPMIIRRCRIALADSGSGQPYHTAKPMAIEDAETYLESCYRASAALAQKAVRDTLAELSDYQVSSACVLLASGRPLPGLASILASHALIHTAEGEFYRAALRKACECCDIEETGIKERELAAQAAKVLGRSAEDLQATIGEFGKMLGSPWTQDEKLSALAAWVALARSCRLA